MKKIKLALLAVIATLGLVSCNDNTKPEPETTGIYKVGYFISDLGQLMDLTNVAVEYKLANGTTKTANVTTLPWSAEVEDVSAPFTAELKVVVNKKDPFPEMIEVNYDLGIISEICVLDSNGATCGYKQSGQITSAGTHVAEIMLNNIVSQSPHIFEYTIAAE